MDDLKKTLYRPEFEHNACGIGFIARTTGVRGHDIVSLALEAIGRMEHRSGIDADGMSGDGAGILTHIPHKLLAAEIDDLPEPGDYALGMFFLPQERTEASTLIIENILFQTLYAQQPKPAANGSNSDRSPVTKYQSPANRHLPKMLTQSTELAPFPNKNLKSELSEAEESKIQNLQWRSVPVNPDVLGETAQQLRPLIKQLIVRRPAHIPRGEAFERLLFTIRRRMDATTARAGLDEFYVASLSAHTVVYKGLMLASYLGDFYPDLVDPRFETALATIHTQFSTATTCNWQRAQPFRMIAHNGEINTLRGNINWMRARESTLASPYWSKDQDDLGPIIDINGSDSGQLDNVLEMLVRAGRQIHHGMAMLVPEAWENLLDIRPDRYAFYRYHSALMEPWDGPAAITFTDGRMVGVTLDRNGLRPMRYLTTTTDLVIATSEAGVVTVDEGSIVTKGKLGPGQMILVDLERQLFLTNDQVKNELARKQQYQAWVNGFKPVATETRPARFTLNQDRIKVTELNSNTSSSWLTRLHATFGYTTEEIMVIVRPMAGEGKEPTGSMGDDTALAVLSHYGRPLFHYFKQHFAQAINPAIDPLHETYVMSLTTRLGARPNLLAESAKHAQMIELASPVLTDADLVTLKGLDDPRFRHHIIPMRYPVDQGADGLRRALDRLCSMAERTVEQGSTIIILSDQGVDDRHAPIPSLLAVGAVHHHLIEQGKRHQVNLVVESGDVHQVHHLACLISYGANAVNPYLALATVENLVATGEIKLDLTVAKRNFVRALEAGLLKIMSKMGISSVESYAGAQVFEAVGLDQALVDKFFSGTLSRLGGIGLPEIAAELQHWHQTGFGSGQEPGIDSPGFYNFTPAGEVHAFDPSVVKALHRAVRLKGALSPQASKPATLRPGETRAYLGANFTTAYEAYKKFVLLLTKKPTIGPRHILDFVDSGQPALPLIEVESLESIFTRFSTAAMSHGALSSEAHETLAIAMNRLGAKSNSGEGGSAQDRYDNERNNGIKQVASGRFGVTPTYLMAANELQLKLAQGAKPGEGGQLPGQKVTAEIAAIRHTGEGTDLISPPPHHDIHSIEDLAQLIYDLKQINPKADVSVKLVSEAGVGTVAAGAVKGGADIIQISGHAGGTGAAAWSSIKNVGLPWEMGLAETQQTLQLNGLRCRVRIRIDGGLQSGRDVVIAALLGADEYSFGTAALVAEGCLLTRACHSNTCPVGIATQRPELRAKFAGKAEHVMAYMHFVAQEVREILAQLGYRSLSDIIGCTELLTQLPADDSPHRSITLASLLEKVSGSAGRFVEPVPKSVSRVAVSELNQMLLKEVEPTLKSGEPIQLTLPINSTDRTTGATLSGAIAKAYGSRGLPDGTISITFHGSAGQGFGAFNGPGVNLTLIGEANDHVAKSMNGGHIVVRPSLKSRLAASDNFIAGNAILYGATGGSLFVAGQAGERFAVRNSGAMAVVEGIGDHGCEYMSGGVVVVLGHAGYNFGAGMSGGVAFVLDEGHHLTRRINRDTVQLVRITSQTDVDLLRLLLMRHVRLTGSEHTQAILDDWSRRLGVFWKVAPKGTIGATRTPYTDQVALLMQELSQHVAA